MGLTRSVGSAAAVLGAATLLASCAPNTSTSGGGEAATDTLTVLGAASTRVINDELDGLARHDLQFINAGSSTLVQQLTDGAPGDLLITANKPTMERAVAAGMVEDPVPVATNSLVMVVPAGNPAGITGVDGSLRGANVVLCDPQVPCGTVSREIMDRQGIRIEAASLEHSVSDTLGKVVSGEADAGWVYRTDALAAGDNVEVLEIPGAAEVPNTLYVAVTQNATAPERARELQALLTGGEMATVWEDNGFAPAEAG